jgi:iron complex transport system substrate-binding protein
MKKAKIKITNQTPHATNSKKEYRNPLIVIPAEAGIQVPSFQKQETNKKGTGFRVKHGMTIFWTLNFIFACLILNFKFVPLTFAGEPPERIVSLAPSITEIVYALGLGNRLVGVTTYCDYPEEAKKKPKIGGMVNPSLETVVSLKPDIVLMTTDGNPKEFEDRLRSLNVKTYVFRARRLSELPQGIRGMGSVLGVKERADKLANRIEEAINKFRDKRRETSKYKNSSLVSRHSPPKKRILFIIWPEPLIVAGPGTAMDDVVTLLSAQNIASKAKVPYPKYSIEEIIYQDPDIIFIGIGNMNMKDVSDGLLRKISMVTAVKKDAVFYMSDRLHRLGPRIVEGIEEMDGYLNGVSK